MTIAPASSRPSTIAAGDPADLLEVSSRTPHDDDAGFDGWPGMASTGDLGAVSADPEPTTLPWSLDDATTRQLRRWSNQLYRLLDSAAPPFGASDDYERVVDELGRREEQAREGAAGARRRDSFRDNPLNRRFELFQDGILAGYVSYSMRAGCLRLHRTVVADAFEGAGLEQILIRNVLLDAHRRRLSALPYCGEVQAFLAGNPQYRALLAG